MSLLLKSSNCFQISNKFIPNIQLGEFPKLYKAPPDPVPPISSPRTSTSTCSMFQLGWWSIFKHAMVVYLYPAWGSEFWICGSISFISFEDSHTISTNSHLFSGLHWYYLYIYMSDLYITFFCLTPCSVCPTLISSFFLYNFLKLFYYGKFQTYTSGKVV